MATVKAVLLCPVASVGAMTGLTANGSLEIAGFWDAIIGVLVLGAMHLPIIGLLIAMWSKPSWRFLGHSFTTWLVLVLIA
jgi:hypothetical protein